MVTFCHTQGAEAVAGTDAGWVLMLAQGTEKLPGGVEVLMLAHGAEELPGGVEELWGDDLGRCC